MHWGYNSRRQRLCYVKWESFSLLIMFYFMITNTGNLLHTSKFYKRSITRLRGCWNTRNINSVLLFHSFISTVMQSPQSAVHKLAPLPEKMTKCFNNNYHDHRNVSAKERFFSLLILRRLKQYNTSTTININSPRTRMPGRQANTDNQKEAREGRNRQSEKKKKKSLTCISKAPTRMFTSSGGKQESHCV